LRRVPISPNTPRFSGMSPAGPTAFQQRYLPRAQQKVPVEAAGFGHGGFFGLKSDANGPI
jgi:hypothetical protein